jgi:cation transport ATPase
MPILPFKVENISGKGLQRMLTMIYSALATEVLYPSTGFLLNPMTAGAALALSSVIVINNSLRLRLKKI